MKKQFYLILIPLLLSVAIPGPARPGDEQETTGAEIYQRFIDALDGMKSLSLDSKYLWTAGGETIGDCTIKYYLEKPDLYRVEIIDRNGKLAGILVCDGTFSWKRWPLGTSFFSQYTGTIQNETKIYTKDPAYKGMSINHQLNILPEVCMPVFNANAFFGGQESVMAYLDDIELLGEEEIEGEPCHKLKVSMMEGQRVRTIWLSKNDHLPRKLFSDLLVANPQTTTEVWSGIAVDTELEDELFAWKPPDDYEERRIPTVEEMILQVGDVAADFTLDDAEGKPLALADFDGKIIWLMFWRIG